MQLGLYERLAARYAVSPMLLLEMGFGPADASRSMQSLPL